MASVAETVGLRGVAMTKLQEVGRHESIWRSHFLTLLPNLTNQRLAPR
jgi:hypothetical protein